jgi:hypothetical protein
MQPRAHSSTVTAARAAHPAIANCIIRSPNTPLPSPPPALAPHWQPDLDGNFTGPQGGLAGQSSLELTLDQSQASPRSSVGRAGRKVWHSSTKHEQFALAALAKRFSAILKRIKSWKLRTSQTLVVPKGDGIRSGSVRQVVEVGNNLLGALWCVPGCASQCQCHLVRTTRRLAGGLRLRGGSCASATSCAPLVARWYDHGLTWQSS